MLTSDPRCGTLRPDTFPKNADDRIALLQGMLDLLILKTLALLG